MIHKALAALIGIFVGGWMLFDGIHVIATGKYFGPAKPGPWSALVIKLHIDPFALGPLFIALGLLWMLILIPLLRGQSWGWYGAVAMAICSLWYFPIGTFLSLLDLLVLCIARKHFLP